MTTTRRRAAGVGVSAPASRKQQRPAGKAKKAASIQGATAKPATVKPKSNRRAQGARRWFCVWTTHAMQIEGRQRGTVIVEDRLALYKASSRKDAEARARREAIDYAEPYLNDSGERVRWQLVSVKDVYELLDETIDADGTEVYSKLREERMRPDVRWPRRS